VRPARYKNVARKKTKKKSFVSDYLTGESEKGRQGA